ncbi:peptidylprolyl isomerase [Candidatus Pelagibacter sp. Uisw_137]|uniref:peptidylprolyl isomerase n=1 Tax=Candidatus Pelagibacter sp. Uisw_137 TaxID=3230992 RepID=UPI0039E787DA|tara:strand:+ start:765 stop:1697 length:933 start_codon:yes stop_codon:yes gene_type:complete
MNKIKFICTLIILLTLSVKSYSNENIHIVYKVNNQIITNADIEKEYQYLISLNNQIKNLDKVKVLEISKESALKEKIKKIELAKYFDLETLDLNIDIYLQNFYKNLNINSDTEFKQYLKGNNMSLDYVKTKIQIEILWNQLIYDRYIAQINIDRDELKKKLDEASNGLNQKIYSLSEILFDKENNSSFEKKLENIGQSISEIGFNNTANIYSISDSSKFGGKIGWVDEKKLSKKIIQELQSLEAGQYTKPIQTGSSFLILKIEEIKYEKAMFNEDEELNKMIQFETSKQLDQFSKIFYNKVKINSLIDEL